MLRMVRSSTSFVALAEGEEEGAVASTDWQFDPHAFPYAGRFPSWIAAHSPTYFPRFVFPYQRVPGHCRKYWRGSTVGPFAVAGSRNILSFLPDARRGKDRSEAPVTSERAI